MKPCSTNHYPSWQKVWADLHILESILLPRTQLYCPPRGGLLVGALLCYVNNSFVIVEQPVDAQAFVDDVIETGNTMHAHSFKEGFALYSKIGHDNEWVEAPHSNHCTCDRYITFPWEVK
jgi:hypoxanthine phosphoribosyltransferase